MYTLLWKNQGTQTWEQFEDRRSLMAAIFKHGLENDPDILIFSPEAEEHLITVEDVAIAL